MGGQIPEVQADDVPYSLNGRRISFDDLVYSVDPSGKGTGVSTLQTPERNWREYTFVDELEFSGKKGEKKSAEQELQESNRQKRIMGARTGRQTEKKNFAYDKDESSYELVNTRTHDINNCNMGTTFNCNKDELATNGLNESDVIEGETEKALVWGTTAKLRENPSDRAVISLNSLNAPYLLSSHSLVPKQFVYRNRFGKEIVMKKKKQESMQVRCERNYVKSSTGAQPYYEMLAEINKTLTDLGEEKLVANDGIKKKNKKKKPKHDGKILSNETLESIKLDENTVEANKLDETMESVDSEGLTRKDYLTRASDLKEDAEPIGSVKMEVEACEETLQEVQPLVASPAKMEKTDVREKPRAKELTRITSSPKQPMTPDFITRAESFPSLCEANPKSNVVEVKKPKKVSPFKHHANRLSKKPLSALPATSNVIIIGENPSTPIIDAAVHGISFFYDQGLGSATGEEATTRRADDSGLGSNTESSSPTEHRPSAGSRNFSDFSKSNKKIVVQNINDLCKLMTEAWDSFMNTGAEPVLYKCC